VLGRNDGDVTMEAITGGDDYELLFTTRPRMRRRIIAAARHAGAPHAHIGACTAVRAVVIRREDADMPVPCGYTHFGRA
jgi:thiamine monophosphate kinase